MSIDGNITKESVLKRMHEMRNQGIELTRRALSKVDANIYVNAEEVFGKWVIAKKEFYKYEKEVKRKLRKRQQEERKKLAAENKKNNPKVDKKSDEVVKADDNIETVSTAVETDNTIDNNVSEDTNSKSEEVVDVASNNTDVNTNNSDVVEEKVTTVKENTKTSGTTNNKKSTNASSKKTAKKSSSKSNKKPTTTKAKEDTSKIETVETPTFFDTHPSNDVQEVNNEKASVNTAKDKTSVVTKNEYTSVEEKLFKKIDALLSDADRAMLNLGVVPSNLLSNIKYKDNLFFDIIMEVESGLVDNIGEKYLEYYKKNNLDLSDKSLFNIISQALKDGKLYIAGDVKENIQSLYSEVIGSNGSIEMLLSNVLQIKKNIKA